jgi:hypothetical protein
MLCGSRLNVANIASSIRSAATDEPLDGAL